MNKQLPKVVTTSFFDLERKRQLDFFLKDESFDTSLIFCFLDAYLEVVDRENLKADDIAEAIFKCHDYRRLENSLHKTLYSIINNGYPHMHRIFGALIDHVSILNFYLLLFYYLACF